MKITVVEIIGIILAFSNVIFTYSWHLCRDSEKLCRDVREKIKANLKSAYKEFGNIIPIQPGANSERNFQYSMERIYKIHNAIFDINKCVTV